MAELPYVVAPEEQRYLSAPLAHPRISCSRMASEWKPRGRWSRLIAEHLRSRVPFLSRDGLWEVPEVEVSTALWEVHETI
jgi:hypothetical protein